jgi:MoxR-like ATPase
MRYSDLKLSILDQFNQPDGKKVVPYIEGAPGGGKSALAKEVGKDMGFEKVKLFYASLRDPVDLLGTPRPDEEVTRWRPKS